MTRLTMSAADRRAWEAARTLDDLGELTARWLEGTIASQPGYEPGCGPDPETAALIPVVARCNRAGYVTCGSQPAEAGTGYDGARWEQRAAVQGFAPAGVAGRIWEAAEAAGLTVITHAPATLPRYRIRYGHAEAVTVRGGRPYTYFGAQLPRRHLRDRWTGYGICHPSAVTALCSAWQVTVLDPQWGRNDRLWPVLRDALAPEAGQAGRHAAASDRPPLTITPAAPADPAAALTELGAIWSPDFDAYASGQLDASAVRCVLCGLAPCGCPPFGTPAYLALVDRLHGRTRGGGV